MAKTQTDARRGNWTEFDTMKGPDTVRLAAYNRMVDVYRNESDRAAAILASSFVDNTLRKLLLAHMVDHPKVNDLFEGDRPLATFSSRITVAFGLGLLPLDRYTDLDLVRKIRNHFAHSEEAASFNSVPVGNWCKDLRILGKQAESELVARGATWDNRDRFLLAVGITMLYLDHLLVGFRNGTLRRCTVPGLTRGGQ